MILQSNAINIQLRVLSKLSDDNELNNYSNSADSPVLFNHIV